jgi:hypothetical protein
MVIPLLLATLLVSTGGVSHAQTDKPLRGGVSVEPPQPPHGSGTPGGDPNWTGWIHLYEALSTEVPGQYTTIYCRMIVTVRGPAPSEAEIRYEYFHRHDKTTDQGIGHGSVSLGSPVSVLVAPPGSAIRPDAPIGQHRYEVAYGVPRIPVTVSRTGPPVRPDYTSERGCDYLSIEGFTPDPTRISGTKERKGRAGGTVTVRWELTRATGTSVSAAPESPLIALSKALDGLAPHYDMTRPHEGLRVIRDILVDMGLEYLIPGLPGAVRRLFGKATAAAGESAGAAVAGAGRGWKSVPPSRPSAGRWPVGGAGTGSPILGGPLPPGVSVPAVVTSKPRPIYLQEAEDSCGAACIRMVVETLKGEKLPEAIIRRLTQGATRQAPGGFTPGVGIEMKRLADSLRAFGGQVTLKGGQTVDDLAAATKNGDPAIVFLGDPVKGHYVVVDAVIGGSAGNRLLLIRDPWNVDLADPRTRQLMMQAGFINDPALPEQSFLGQFAQGGSLAIFTGP